MDATRELRDLAVVFLKLGTIGFGGPAAHIAMMEDEVVARRQWLTREEFLDLLAATNLIPGPNSTEMAIHIGYRRAGWPGLIVAGLCFMLPAIAIVTVAAWAYVTYGTRPAVGGVLYAIKPAIIAIVVQALWRLGRTALKTVPLAMMGVLALVLSMSGIGELVVLFGVAAVALIVPGAAAKRKAESSSKELRTAADQAGETSIKSIAAVPITAVGATLPASATNATAHAAVAGGTILAAAGATSAPAATGVTLASMFFVFLKIGSVLFGSGYVLLAFIRGDFVERLGWLSEAQLLDAVAVGQVTPGPLFTTATFIGYVLGGLPGAAVATAGIFLPAFVFVAMSGKLVPLLRRSSATGRFLDGLVAVSVGLLAAVSWELARASIVDGKTAAIAAVSAGLVFGTKFNSAWIVLGAATVGIVL